MLFKNIAMIDENGYFSDGMFLATEGALIKRISHELPAENYGREYDGEGKVLLPGLVNNHTHVPMVLLRGLAENLPLSRWLKEAVGPIEGEMTADDIYFAAQLSAAEMLSSGITSATDMYFGAATRAKAFLEVGMKCNLSIPLVCDEDRSLCDLPIFSAMENLRENVHLARDGLIRLDCSIHSEYTSSPKLVRQMGDYAAKYALNMHVHLSETREENEACKVRNHGITPAGYFEEQGLFQVPTTAAHCVYLENSDYNILREHQVSVACCPYSNMKLGSGFCNAKKLLQNGISVTIGTDGAASNNSQSLLEEMKLFSLLNKAVNSDPTALTPEETLFAATRAGALAQGRSDCGKLSEGARADLIVIDSDKPQYYPAYSPLNNLIYAGRGSDVCLTMVDGQVLYEDGTFKTIDIGLIKKEIYKRAGRLKEAALGKEIPNKLADPFID